MGGELRLRLAEEGADDERVERLSGLLLGELRQLDVEEVAALTKGQPPPGARGLDVTDLGALLVTLGSSAEALRSVVGVVRQWLGRGDGAARTVRLEIGGDVLELSGASEAGQQRLVEFFVREHTRNQA